MKLLYCFHCGDIFNLDRHLKKCACGRVKGMYTNSRDAVVNGQGVSLAMGNGSFESAVMQAENIEADFRNDGDVWRRHATSIICWARPHEGPANSHTTVNPDL